MYYVLVIFLVVDLGFFWGWGGFKKYVFYKYIDFGGGFGFFNYYFFFVLKVYCFKEIIKY